MLPSRYRILLALCCIQAGLVVHSQGGSLDMGFDPGDAGNGAGHGAGEASAVVVRSDGKILLGGTGTYNRIPRRGVALLNSDGSLDTSFDPGLGTSGFNIKCVAALPAGKVLVGGTFTSFNGVSRRYLVRLLASGAVDNTFPLALSAVDSIVHCMAVQADGKILIGGFFSNIAGTPRGRIARLNSDGTLDNSFAAGTGFTGEVRCLAVQPDGRILVGGSLGLFNGASAGAVARLTSTGALDASFANAATYAYSGGVRSIALRSDGGIVAGGSFATFGPALSPPPMHNAVLLDASGAVVPGWSTGTGFYNEEYAYSNESHAYSVAVDASDRIYVGGAFYGYQGSDRPGVLRLLANGTLDPTFAPDHAIAHVGSMAITATGDLLCASDESPGVRRLSGAGITDQGFNAGTGGNSSITRVVRTADGKFLASGHLLHRFNGSRANSLVRFNASGVLDPSFNSGTGFFDKYVFDMLPMPDGRIIVVGDFTRYQGSPRKAIVRLLPDGSIDPLFNVDMSQTAVWPYDHTIESCALQADGRLLICGHFNQVNGVARQGVARLLSDGALDASFIPPAVSNPRQIIAAPGGGCYVVGAFNTVAGVARPGVVKLTSTGALDTAYDPLPGMPTANRLRALLMDDGRLLVSAGTTGYPGIVRLSASGAIDPSFQLGISTGLGIWDMALLPDGKLIVSGSFQNYMSTGRNSIVRLNSDGSLDTSFGVSVPANNTVYDAQPMADGGLLMCGGFTALNGVGRNSIAKVWLGGAAGLSLTLRALLDGPYVQASQRMNDALRSASLLPPSDPYPGLGLPYPDGAMNGTVGAGVLNTTGDNAIVDWVYVALRNTAQETWMSKGALLQRDGDVVALDGTSPLVFNTLPGSYHVAIRHRNHLGMMTATAVALSGSTTSIDFTSLATTTYGSSAQKQVGSKMVMWAGDATGNGQLRYTGTGNDRDPIILAIGGTTPNNTLSNVYDRRDTNLDGVIKYTGSANDRDIILTNVGSTTPNNTRTQQLP